MKTLGLNHSEGALQMIKNFIRILIVLSFTGLIGSSLFADEPTPTPAATPEIPGSDGTVYGFQVLTLDGKPAVLSQYEGKVLLIVNVASKCGFTPQYKGLEALYEKYKNQGLVILGFPCNQFANQEPGTPSEIKSFCQLNYGVTFPLFAKIEVNGPNTHPLYQFLKKKELDPAGKSDIGWNFNKFLINREGLPLKRYVSQVKPEEIDAEIKMVLASK
jgi:glutathione peroxidase